MKRCLAILTVLLSLLLTLSLVSCGAKSPEAETGAVGGDYAVGDSSNGAAIDKGEGAGDVGMSPDDFTSTTLPEAENRKIIKTYRLRAETQEFDNALKKLNEMLTQSGGYIESSNIYGTGLKQESGTRTADYTLRIPADKAEGFVNGMGDVLKVTQSNSNVEDVSMPYYSIEARLAELRTERDSLLAMMESLNNKTDYDFWLTLQSRLSSVKQEIAVYESQLKNYDSRVSYSTVYLNLSEVKVYTSTEEDHFGTQLGNAFATGWNGFTEFLSDLALGIAEGFPFLIILAAIIVTAVLLIKRARKKKKMQRLDALHEEKDETE